MDVETPEQKKAVDIWYNWRNSIEWQVFQVMFWKQKQCAKLSADKKSIHYEWPMIQLAFESDDYLPNLSDHGARKLAGLANKFKETDREGLIIVKGLEMHDMVMIAGGSPEKILGYQFYLDNCKIGKVKVEVTEKKYIDNIKAKIAVKKEE
jgi:hypothetical protein